MSQTISFKEAFKNSETLSLRTILFLTLAPLALILLIAHTTDQSLFHYPQIGLLVLVIGAFGITTFFLTCTFLIQFGFLKFRAWMDDRMDQRIARVVLRDPQTIKQLARDVSMELNQLQNNEHIFALDTATPLKNAYPCVKCKKLFEAHKPDDLFTIAMRDRCFVCDMLDLTMFRRWRYICTDCGEINYILWHHWSKHSNTEIRSAEKMYIENDES